MLVRDGMSVLWFGMLERSCNNAWEEELDWERVIGFLSLDGRRTVVQLETGFGA